MQRMSGLDLSVAVSELAHLQGKRISRIRKTEGGIFLFKIGSEEVLFQPGIRLHLTWQAFAATERPDGFVSFLRKHFEGKTAAQIAQVPNERIVEITTKSKERLVFELFRKGNLIAVGEDGKIMACLYQDEAGGRKISKGETYACPKPSGFCIKAPEKLSFWVQLKDGLPVSFSIGEGGGEGKKFDSLSEALDFYYANQPEQSEAEKALEERKAKILERIAAQKKAAEEISAKREKLKSAADLIYANFEQVESLLEEVRKMKKAGMSDAQINERLAPKRARVKERDLFVEL
ncbi:MAG: NFACT family protein [Candidatus Micrarchaeota archaeon]|nr:NFACT family protein [Candidatus Micrarchaeota archaeon]